ncbi:MAG: EF-hand domain-containing protein [Roseovarius sp.]|uniref:EF-hand domain-containing protein n=1 Tax=Roseovarius sp. TaxID=1486281 RepID=UPI0032EE9FDB
MKNGILMASLSAAILAAAATQGLAASDDSDKGHHGKRPSFEELDANGDGVVSREEMQARMQARFDEADADGDGRITREEMSARMEARASERRERFLNRMFERQDADADGALTLEEMRGDRADRMFAKVDQDGDGNVSREEFDAMKERMHKRHGKHKRGDDVETGQD